MANKSELKYVIQPNLPQDKVAMCAVSDRFKDIVNALSDMNIKVLSIPRNKDISAPVADHADLQILHLGDKNVVALPNVSERLKKYGFNITEYSLSDGFSYPSEAELCSLITPKFVFGLNNIFEDIVINPIREYVHVKQGYTKCSVAVVSENAYMTSDVGMYRLLCNYGYDVLLLPAGDIELPPYEYGFIGGCCGKLSKNTIGFTGSLNKYIYGDRVKSFLEKHGVKPVYLMDTRLFDIGGILPLMEYGT